jgi:hypothetical protein
VRDVYAQGGRVFCQNKITGLSNIFGLSEVLGQVQQWSCDIGHQHVH